MRTIAQIADLDASTTRADRFESATQALIHLERQLAEAYRDAAHHAVEVGDERHAAAFVKARNQAALRASALRDEFPE